MKKTIKQLAIIGCVLGALTTSAVANQAIQDTSIQATIINDSSHIAHLTHDKATPWLVEPSDQIAPGQRDIIKMPIGKQGAGFILGYHLNNSPANTVALQGSMILFYTATVKNKINRL